MSRITFLTLMLIVLCADVSGLKAEAKHSFFLSPNKAGVCFKEVTKFRQVPAGETIIAPPDTTVQDTTQRDSLTSVKIKRSSDSLDAPVKYHADDSTWMDVTNKKVYLLGNASVEYKDITLTADSIVFDWSNNQVSAFGRKDSSGKVAGKPVFSQGDRTYKAEQIAYNFKSKKGKISEIITEEGEGFIHSDVVKRLPNEVLYGQNNKYTTCSLDHPHFYIATNKIKIIPNKAVVTGPADLVVADVRTPLLVPFGIFPLSEKRKSGIIFPSYGERSDLGFYLQHGGYYFGISDHVDLALTGDIYSKGSWLVNASSRFISKYKFSGSLNLTYANTRIFDPEANTYLPNTQFNVRANYTQDPKARPNSYFSANVSFGTSGFNQLFGDPQDTYLNNQYTSSISFRQTIPNSPFNFTISASHFQSTLTHLVTLQLPVFNFNMSQIYPFKRKEVIGNQRWYEKIGITYTLDAKNQVSAFDSMVFTQETFNETMAGIRHQIPVSMSFQVLKYLTVTPSLSYTETWAFQTINKTWNDSGNFLITDTIREFAAARDFTSGISASTRLYGMLQFKGNGVKALRHVFNPSISYSYHPDFTLPQWDAYRTVQVDSTGRQQSYSIFEGGVYTGPPSGEFNGLSFSLNNNLEMKVVSKKDTISGTKKVKLLESFTLSGGYNFAADSFRMQTFSMAGRTTLFDRIGINFSSSFDPYIADTLGVRKNIYLWDAERKLARLTNASIGLDASFASKKREGGKEMSQQQLDYLVYSQNQYSDFSIPWNFRVGYNLFIRKINASDGADSTTLTQTLSVGGSFNLTRNWRVSGSTSYDFVNKEFPTASVEIYRDLHCWELSFSWIPFGIRQSYNITLRVKASVLQDLKLRKQQDWYEY